MSNIPRQSKIAWILALAMLLNMFISAYILLQEFSSKSGTSIIGGDSCFLNSTTQGGGDCYQVQNSAYSSFLGFPISGWGLILFLFMAIALGAFAFSLKNHKPITYYELPHFRRLLHLAFAAALISALWFIFAQLFLIHAICKYCSVIDVVTVIAAITFFISFKRD